MNSIRLLCVGALKERFYREAASEYIKRLGRFAKLSVIEISECPARGKSVKDISAVKSAEGKSIVAALRGCVIALDSGGDNLSSGELAEKIAALTDKGTEISFVIGGSHGLSDDVLKRADMRLSFGKQTYPHQLMRVILLEQVYRSFMITAGAEYHK